MSSCPTAAAPQTQPSYADSPTHAYDGQIQVQICQDSAGSGASRLSARMLDPSSSGRDIVECQNEAHFMSILDEVVGDRKNKRMIRIVVEDDSTPPNHVCRQGLPANVQHELSGLDETDIAYLFEKRAFWLPPPHCW